MLFRVNSSDAFRQSDRFEVFASHIRVAIIVACPFYSCGAKFFAAIGNHCFFAEIRDADEAFSILCVEKAVDRSVFWVAFGYHDIFRRQIHKYFQIETACQFNGFHRRINVKLKDGKILVASIGYFYISRHLDLCQFFTGTQNAVSEFFHRIWYCDLAEIRLHKGACSDAFYTAGDGNLF